MKKKIIIGIFCTLILVTIIYSIVGAIQSYNHDIETNVDIFEGFGAVIALMLGGLFVIYELDLFYTVYYFLIKPKTVVKSVLNIVSNLSLLTIIYCVLSPNFFRIISKPFLVLFKNEDGLVALAFFFSYIVLRASYSIVCVVNEKKLTTK